jgi:pimeloyl-ACP methyl ester carboxylesterase
MNIYQEAMQPYPDLANYATRFHLPKAGLDLFGFQAGDTSDPLVILVHGLGDDADTWRHIIPELSKNFRVIAFDLPGFGRSDKPDVTYSVQFFREVILELIDLIDRKPVTLIGHSLGAILTQAVTLSAPQEIKQLVLIAGGMAMKSQKLDAKTMFFLIPGIGEWLYNRLRKDPQAAYDTLKPYYSSLEDLPKEDRDFLFVRVNQRVWNNDQRRGYFSTFRNLARWLPKQQSDLAAHLSGLNTPTLILWGESDRMNPVENGRYLAQIQPDTRLEVIPSAAHNLHQEQPEQVLAALQNFLDRS